MTARERLRLPGLNLSQPGKQATNAAGGQRNARVTCAVINHHEEAGRSVHPLATSTERCYWILRGCNMTLAM
jgi:hypothetical protein